MAVKKYNDKKLKKYFERYVEVMSVDDRFKPLIIDILMRRADTYDLSKEEIRQDVISLLYNLKEISVEEMPENYSSASGLYIPNEKKIIIAESEMDLENQTEIYQTITHEVYHALSADLNGRDRLGGYNTITGEYNSSLLEAIVEKSSYRAVFGNDSQENAYFNNSASGYSDITFIVDLLSATYGVGEKEFLKNGIMGREQLATFLAEHSGETPESAYTFLDAIEANYSLLHGTLYPFPGEEPTRYEMSLNIENALTGIYNLCEGKMAERISRTQVESYEDVYNFNNELMFNHNRITEIMHDRLTYFSNLTNTNLVNGVMGRVYNERVNTLSIINDINNLVEAAPNFSDEENFLNGYEWASTGTLSQLPLDTLNYFQIGSKFHEDFPMTDEIIEAAFEDEVLGPQYDNSKIPKMIKKINKKDNIFMRGINKIIGLFSRNNQKLLTEGGQPQMSSRAEEAEIETIFPQVTREEQAMYNAQVKQAVDSLGKNQTTEEIDRDIEEK